MSVASARPTTTTIVRRAAAATVALCAALPARRAAAQAADDGARLYPLLSVGAARSLPTTLAERGAARTTPAGAYRESMRVRLDGQWGIIAEGRLPIGGDRVWGIEAYGARFRGRARVSAGMESLGAVAGTATQDSIDYRLGGVTSWRGTLGVVRAAPLPGGWTGAVLVGGTYGTITSPDRPCTTTSCPPRLDLATPGVTLGADAFTRPWKRLRLRFSVKDDVLRVDEAEVRRSLRWAALTPAPAGEGRGRWHMFPTGTIGVEYELPF